MSSRRAPLSAEGVGEALARILRTDPSGVPPCPPEHPDPAAHWRGWLGSRGLGLVPIDAPAAFSWGGPWLAILPGPEPSGPLRAAVAFGAPAGLLWISGTGAPEHADGAPTRRLLADVLAGFAVAPFVPAELVPPAAAHGPGSGRPTADAPVGAISGLVTAIALAPAATGPVRLVDTAVAEAGRGLVGDRYHAQAGTFSAPGATGTALTLVDADLLAAIPAPPGPLDLAASRRNIATTGIDLDALIGREFLIGDVRCLGRRRAEPCAHLERLAGPSTLRALVHRGGLRADVLQGGTIRIGDAVRADDGDRPELRRHPERADPSHDPRRPAAS